MTNYGNQITGGTFSGATTVGDNATVNYSAGDGGEGGGADEAVSLARELRALVERHAASLEKPGPAIRDAAEVADELALPAEEQDRDRLSDTLARLAARVGSVGALAEATKRLTDLLFA
ncbi:hypothetical protein [Streptosporangium lutulentum]|uniref:Uncharacterized protein n=1 Tax=Streptosporangium lutulentum TaxID=1461250 RepID=A0ABT9QSQ4_9ACTN|nr:hypothetical protein [Streptosporangium lutulentum]MDP9849797.1 hypothetical protein [Streptosporangium lutulentum]